MSDFWDFTLGFKETLVSSGIFNVCVKKFVLKISVLGVKIHTTKWRRHTLFGILMTKKMLSPCMLFTKWLLPLWGLQFLFTRTIPSSSKRRGKISKKSIFLRFFSYPTTLLLFWPRLLWPFFFLVFSFHVSSFLLICCQRDQSGFSSVQFGSTPPEKTTYFGVKTFISGLVFGRVTHTRIISQQWHFFPTWKGLPMERTGVTDIWKSYLFTIWLLQHLINHTNTVIYISMSRFCQPWSVQKKFPWHVKPHLWAVWLLFLFLFLDPCLQSLLLHTSSRDEPNDTCRQDK